MAKTSNASQQTAIALPEEIELIRFEKNLLQIGFFSAHDRRSKSDDTIRRIEQWVNRKGKRIRVSAEFRSSLGLPSTADRDKYMAFMKIAMDRKMMDGVITNPIRFSGYSMLKVLGLSDAGANYEDLNQWGMRMADTTITSEQIIYSTSNKTFMNKTVHVFRSFTRMGTSDLDDSNSTVRFAIELEDWLLDNLNQSYVVPEDFTQYRKLVRPTSKGIFVYLYVWFYASKGKDVEKDYAELCTLLNVRCYQHVSKIKETMGLSLDDLVKIGYLKTWKIEPMSSKKGYKLVLKPGKSILEVIADTQQRQLALVPNGEGVPPEFNSAQRVVKSALVSEGISDEKADSLCRLYDSNLLLDRLDYAITEIAKDRGGRFTNPAGFIISIIEGDRAIPQSYEIRSARIARLKEAEEQQKLLDKQQRANLAEQTFRERYEAWKSSQADAAIQANYSAIELERRLKEIRATQSKNSTIAATFSRVTRTQLREMLMRSLRKMVASELHLPPYEEWLEINGQGTLFED